MLGEGQGAVQVEHDEQGHSRLRDALIECSDRCSRYRRQDVQSCALDGFERLGGQFDKRVVENAEDVSKSGHTELREVIVGSCTKN